MKKQFRPLNLRGVPRKPLSVNRFLGVDFTTPKFLIENGRAVDSLNFIYKDNVLQKRNGFEELFKIGHFRYLVKDFDGNIGTTIHDNLEDFNGNKTTNYNGLWSFIAEDGKRHVIAHIGKLLYEIVDKEAKPIFTQKGTAEDEGGAQKNVCYEYENYVSSAFVGDYKLWFLGGNKFMCIRFLLNGESRVEPVEDSELAHVPTTTISITYNDSRVSNRQSLDNVNLLTMYRKNKLISGTLKKETLEHATEYYEYPLDSPMMIKSPKDMAQFEMVIEERGVIDNG